MTGGHACRRACGDGADGVGVLSPRLSNKLLQEHQGRRDDWVFVTHRFSAHGAFWEQQNFLWARTLLGGTQCDKQIMVAHPQPSRAYRISATYPTTASQSLSARHTAGGFVARAGSCPRTHRQSLCPYYRHRLTRLSCPGGCRCQRGTTPSRGSCCMVTALELSSPPPGSHRASRPV